MFALSFVSRDLEFWSVNRISMYKSYELNIFKNIRFASDVFDNWLSDLLGTNVYKTLEYCW